MQPNGLKMKYLVISYLMYCLLLFMLLVLPMGSVSLHVQFSILLLLSFKANIQYQRQEYYFGSNISLSIDLNCYMLLVCWHNQILVPDEYLVLPNAFQYTKQLAKKGDDNSSHFVVAIYFLEC